MSRQELFKRMAQSIIDGEMETAGELARESLVAGIDAMESINQGFKAGLDEIGRGFEAGDYFLPDLMVSGRAMQAAVAILGSALEREGDNLGAGKVILATVEGDLHTIGKDLVGLMLEVDGFEVIDLGYDAATDTILESVMEEQPDVIGLSCLLTTSNHAQRDVIEGLAEMGVRAQVKVLVGGAATTSEWAREIGADGYAADAAAAVRKAREVLGVS
jgi:corrinoid protein of di/trimethylamine methyltransferase